MGKSTTSIAIAVPVHPDDLLALHKVLTPSSKTSREDVPPQAAVLSMLHLAWTVTVRRWAGIDTFCIGGNYRKGVCYVHDRDIPDSMLIQLNPEDSLQELFHQLSSAMAADAPSASHKISSRSRGNYSASICLRGSPSQKYEAMEKIPQVLETRSNCLTFLTIGHRLVSVLSSS